MVGKTKRAQGTPTPKKKPRIVNAASDADVAKALRFIGRLAVRLQGTGAGLNQQPLSGPVLETALSHAVEQLPEGPLKSTLTAESERFAAAFADRVGSLTSSAKTSAEDKRFETAVNGDVVTDAGYVSAVEALSFQLDSSHSTDWKAAVSRLIGARIPSPAALFAAQASLAEKSLEQPDELAVAEAVVQALSPISFCTPDRDSATAALLPVLLPVQRAVAFAASLKENDESGATSARKAVRRCERLISQLQVAAALRQQLNHGSQAVVPKPPLSAVGAELGTVGEVAASVASVTSLLRVVVAVLSKRTRRKGAEGSEVGVSVRSLAAEALVGLWSEAQEKLLESLLNANLPFDMDLTAEEHVSLRVSVTEALLAQGLVGSGNRAGTLWLRKAAVAREVHTLLRARGERSRGVTLLALVREMPPPAELKQWVGKVVKQRKGRLEIPAGDPHGLAAWLLSSADEQTFKSVLEVGLTGTVTLPVPEGTSKGDISEGEALFFLDKGAPSRANELGLGGADAMLTEAAVALAEEQPEEEKRGGASPSSSEEKSEELPEWMRDSDDEDEVGPQGGLEPVEDDEGTKEAGQAAESDSDVDKAVSPQRGARAEESVAPEEEEAGDVVADAMGVASVTPAKPAQDALVSSEVQVGDTTVKKKEREVTPPTGDVDELSPLHTRRKKAVQTPVPASVLRSVRKKKGEQDEPDKWLGKEKPPKAKKDEKDEAARYISPLHTRSGKVVAATPSKPNAEDEVARYISPLHTRSGKVAAATPSKPKAEGVAQATPLRSARKKKGSS